MEEEVLSDQVVLDGKRAVVTLDASGVLRWRGEEKPSGQQLVVANDLIGFSRSSGSSNIRLYTFKMTERSSTSCCGKSASLGRTRKDMVVEFSDGARRELWCGSIQRILDQSGRPKRLLLIVNPFGGQKAGRKVYTSIVEPLLKAAGVSYTLRETQYQCHAKELAMAADLLHFDGIVCVSGDGVLVEVLNGLLERPDGERAIKMPIGIIPAGTGNGMAKSLLDHVGEPCDAASATFLVIRGQTQPLDVATARQSNIKFHLILMLAWGLVADVDIESERLRWMGALRLDVYTLMRICNLRRYTGHVHYIPAPGYEGTGTPLQGELETATLLKSGDSDGSDNKSLLRKNSDSEPLQTSSSQWRDMEGPFILIWLNNVPFSGEDLKSAPNAKFSDGCLDLIVMKECPRWTLLNLLLKVQTGEHIKSKYVEYIKVKAFRLDPGGQYGSDIQGGYIDVDGEILARGRGSVGNASNDLMSYGPPVEVWVGLKSGELLELGLTALAGVQGDCTRVLEIQDFDNLVAGSTTVAGEVCTQVETTKIKFSKISDITLMETLVRMGAPILVMIASEISRRLVNGAVALSASFTDQVFTELGENSLSTTKAGEPFPELGEYLSLAVTTPNNLLMHPPTNTKSDKDLRPLLTIEIHTNLSTSCDSQGSVGVVTRLQRNMHQSP